MPWNHSECCHYMPTTIKECGYKHFTDWRKIDMMFNKPHHQFCYLISGQSNLNDDWNLCGVHWKPFRSRQSNFKVLCTRLAVFSKWRFLFILSECFLVCFEGYFAKKHQEHTNQIHHKNTSCRLSFLCSGNCQYQNVWGSDNLYFWYMYTVLLRCVTFYDEMELS